MMFLLIFLFTCVLLPGDIQSGFMTILFHLGTTDGSQLIDWVYETKQNWGMYTNTMVLDNFRAGQQVIGGL